MDVETEGASGTWLAAPRELRELHKDAAPSPGSVESRAVPRPPPPAPSPDDVVDLQKALLERGVYEAAVDSVSKKAFYYDVRSGSATWFFQSMCEVHYHELVECLQRVDSCSPSTSSKHTSTTPLPRRRVATASPPIQRKPTGHQPTRTSHRESSTSISQTQWRERVIDLYRAHDASKISLVDELLGRYRGREDELWRHLKSKYASPPNKKLSRSSTHGNAEAMPGVSLSPRSSNAGREGGHVSSPLQPCHGDVQTEDDGTCTLDAKDLDVYMHRHHGDTHAVSYRSLSNASSKSPPRPTEEAPPAPTTNYCSGNDTAVLQTPNVSTIDGDSESDEAATQREALAAARAAAEAKAHKVLYASGSAAASKGAKRVAAAQVTSPAAPSSKGAHPAPTAKSSQQVWSNELIRREEQLAARRLFVQQERSRAKAMREDEMRRRADELKRIREAEDEARRLATGPGSCGSGTTPKRPTQAADLNIERPSSAKRAASARRRHSEVRDASPTVAFSARTNNGRQHDVERPLAQGANPSPTKHQRKLSASEMRSSVERLYQRSSGQKQYN